MVALKVYEKNNRLLEMGITKTELDGSSSAMDLSNCEVSIYVKRRARDDDPAPVIATVTDAVNGMAQAYLDTGAPRTAWIRIDVLDIPSSRVVTVYANTLVVIDG